MPEAGTINRMFAGIARRYDSANHVMSGGADIYYRRRLVGEVVAALPADGGSVLDLATGSGDVAFAIVRRLGERATVTGLDFCQPMLDEAEAKKKRDPRYAAITFGQGDCLALPVPDASADVVTISFGLRNLEDRHKGLQEMRRVLKPGGTLLVLEFTQPRPWLRPFYYFYLRHFLPLIARVVTGNRDAYEYLVGSVKAFPPKEALSEEIRAAGFTDVTPIGLTGDIVAIHRSRV